MELARRFEEKKYMWDGETYPNEKNAQEIAQKYEANGFQVKVFTEDNMFYVFSRREVVEETI